MEPAPFAHNGASDLHALEAQIWFSGEPLIVKGIALAILHHMSATKDYAWPSKKRLAEMCSVHVDTIERNIKAIGRWIEIIQRKGQSNIYRARLQQASIELYDLLQQALPKEDEGELPPRTMQVGKMHEPTRIAPPGPVPPTRIMQEGTPPHDAPGLTPTPPHGAPLPPRTMPPRTINRIEKEVNARGKSVNGREFWAKELNPTQAVAHDNIKRDENGDILVSNGMRVKLEGILNGRADLNVALGMVKGKISPDANGMWLANRVESVLSEWVMEHDRKAKFAGGGKVVGKFEPEPGEPPRVFRNRLRSKYKNGDISADVLYQHGITRGSEAQYE